MTHPAQAPSLEIREVDENVLVYDTTQEKIHVLNRTAGFILGLCDGTRSPAEMARSLCAATGADISLVRGDVDAILTDFAALKLLSD